ncbi:hypothetical protein ACFVUS_20730 [Nocardia sp. NPDC058058]|uniref:hypothetical protein n=1 Tax=Nocardia sp. NPDC058058 TaxID=3346317 RepID=UPI0036DC3CB1
MRALFPTLSDYYNPDGSLKTPEQQKAAGGGLQSQLPTIPDPAGQRKNVPFIPGITAPTTPVSPQPITVTAEATVPTTPQTVVTATPPTISPAAGGGSLSTDAGVGLVPAAPQLPYTITGLDYNGKTFEVNIPGASNPDSPVSPQSDGPFNWPAPDSTNPIPGLGGTGTLAGGQSQQLVALKNAPSHPKLSAAVVGAVTLAGYAGAAAVPGAILPIGLLLATGALVWAAYRVEQTASGPTELIPISPPTTGPVPQPPPEIRPVPSPTPEMVPIEITPAPPATIPSQPADTVEIPVLPDSLTLPDGLDSQEIPGPAEIPVPPSPESDVPPDPALPTPEVDTPVRQEIDSDDVSEINLPGARNDFGIIPSDIVPANSNWMDTPAATDILANQFLVTASANFYRRIPYLDRTPNPKWEGPLPDVIRAPDGEGNTKSGSPNLNYLYEYWISRYPGTSVFLPAPEYDSGMRKLDEFIEALIAGVDAKGFLGGFYDKNGKFLKFMPKILKAEAKKFREQKFDIAKREIGPEVTMIIVTDDEEVARAYQTEFQEEIDSGEFAVLNSTDYFALLEQAGVEHPNAGVNFYQYLENQGVGHLMDKLLE